MPVRQKRLFKLKIILMITVLAALLADNCSAKERLRVLFLGDSLTAGYGIDQAQSYPHLVQKIASSEGFSIDIINAGMSGDTSAGALRRLSWLLKNKIDICIVALGANDGLRGLPTSALRENLLKIISQLKSANPSMKVILAGMKLPENFGQDYLSEFEVVFAEVSEKSGAILITFLLEGVAGNQNLNLEDRLHPNEQGQKIIAQTVWKTLRQLM